MPTLGELANLEPPTQEAKEATHLALAKLDRRIALHQLFNKELQGADSRQNKLLGALGLTLLDILQTLEKP